MTTELLVEETRLRVDVDPSGVEVQGGPSGPLVIIGVGTQGPSGPPGPIGPSGGAGFTRTSPSSISGHKVVRTTGLTSIEYADAFTIGHRDTVLGITTNAAIPGDPVTVVTGGEIVEPSWSWTAGLPVFVGANGALTQTFSSSWAWVRIMGVASSPTSLIVGLREPMTLNP